MFEVSWFGMSNCAIDTVRKYNTECSVVRYFESLHTNTFIDMFRKYVEQKSRFNIQIRNQKQMRLCDF